MRVETLPSPGILSMGIRLRTEAAKAISAVEIFSDRSGGTSGSATQLHTFFTACATAIASLRDTTAPTVVSRTQATGANRIVITTSEGLDPRIIPPLTSFVTSPARTITGVTIEGTRVLVDYTGASLANGNTIAYTQPTGLNKLQDPGGNLLATFTAAAIVVS
jgi:hypothetical protein